MPEKDPAPSSSTEELLAELRLRAESLERQLADVKHKAEARIVHSELKAEALRAGIADPDGLRLLDMSKVKFTDDGGVQNAAELIGEMKQTRPWLFPSSTRSSSTAAPVPPAQPPRTKLAMDMTEEEWRSARAALLKRHV